MLDLLTVRCRLEFALFSSETQLSSVMKLYCVMFEECQVASLITEFSYRLIGFYCVRGYRLYLFSLFWVASLPLFRIKFLIIIEIKKNNSVPLIWQVSRHETNNVSYLAHILETQIINCGAHWIINLIHTNILVKWSLSL